jgi:hypothetical protein
MFIGGGGSMISAMLWCMIADAVPVEDRTAVYYRIAGASMIVNLVSNPLAAALLRIDPWIPVLFGCGLVGLGVLVVLVVLPETLDIRRAADRQIERQIERAVHDTARPGRRLADGADAHKTGTLWGRTVATMENDMGHVWRFLLGSRDMMLLIIPFSLNVSALRHASFDIARQYIHKRYDLDWADVSPPVPLALRNGC